MSWLQRIGLALIIIPCFYCGYYLGKTGDVNSLWIPALAGIIGAIGLVMMGV